MVNYDNLKNIIYNIFKFGPNNFIIITGGIGDFLILDSFFSFSCRKNIIFISKQSIRLKKLMEDYNGPKKYFAYYFNFSLLNKPGFENSEELLNNIPIWKKLRVPIVNIKEFFPIIRNNLNGKLILNDNYLNKIMKTNIKQMFGLPETYAVICPFTEDRRIDCIHCNHPHRGFQKKCKLTRNFIHEDYMNILPFLKKNNLIGVILSTEKINILEEGYKDSIINFSSYKISLINCMEIIKQSSYYFGIDGVFSTIANKVLEKENVFIKCNNKHGFINKDIYWYPNNDINLQSILHLPLN